MRREKRRRKKEEADEAREAKNTKVSGDAPKKSVSMGQIQPGKDVNGNSGEKIVECGDSIFLINYNLLTRVTS